MYNIAVIGAGQLGSRHLQGLANSSKQFNIYLVDTSEKALAIAQQRFEEVSNSDNSSVFYHQNISALPEKINVSIVATTANVRRMVVEELLAKCSIKYLIFEKVVFQKSEDFLPILKLLRAKEVIAWVNCARRSYPFYNRLKKKLNSDIISIKVVGNNWGLACNSIHMIDLLAYLTGRSEFKFDTIGLENCVIDSKRNGFKELKGMLKINNRHGDTLEFSDNEKCDENLNISISSNGKKYDIYESNGLVIKHVLNSKSEENEINIPFQSELTGKIIDQILDTGESALTPYYECMKYHIPMLDAFNGHISKVIGKTVTISPIT